MMLWMNLLQDTMAALALASELPDDSQLHRRPYKRNARLISRPMWRSIVIMGLYQV